MNRVGDWITTYTGQRFYPLDPRPEEVRILDIAHALSKVCRFGGHCLQFYSVAQHSVLVSYVEPTLWALLHDAAEAYIGDLTSPLKRSLKEAGQNFYAEAEQRIMKAVCERFNLPLEEPAAVKAADMTLLYTEARDLLQDGLKDWRPGPTPLHVTVVPVTSGIAACQFLERYVDLTGVRT